MDPFTQLSPEIRIMILGQIASHATTSRLIRASPVMLSQYTSPKSSPLHAFLTNMCGVGHDYNDLLQDALGIIYLNDSWNDKQLTSYCVRQWVMKNFPSPFLRSDINTIATLRRLFARIGDYIEDYINKATSFFPPAAYLRVPQISCIGGIDPKRLTLDDLTWSELYRFFRAFIKYEILCKIHHPRVKHSMDRSQYRSLSRDSRLTLNPRDYESLHCVYEYLKAVYGALFAKCSDTWSPEVYESSATPSRNGRGKSLLYPDNLCFSASTFLYEMRLPKECTHLSTHIPCQGFSLVAHLIRSACKNQQIDQVLRTWFYSVSEEWNDRSWSTWSASLPSPGLDPNTYISHTGLCTELLPRLPDHEIFKMLVRTEYEFPKWHVRRNMLFQLDIYRQRAWVFFDNKRLFPDLSTHFPSIAYLCELNDETEFKYLHTWVEQKRRRSREWQDYWSGRTLERPSLIIDDEECSGSQEEQKIEDDDGLDLPAFFDCPVKQKLTTFWRHDAKW